MVEKVNKCPFCGKKTLVPFDEVGQGWLKCSKCGATHHPHLLKLIPSPILAETWRGEEGISHFSPRGVRKARAKSPA